MTVAQVEAGVRARYAAEIASALMLQTVYENDGQDEPTDVIQWARVSVLTGESQQKTLGKSKTFRHNGVLIVCLFVKPKSGTRSVMLLASQIASILRSSIVSGIAYLDATVQKIGVASGWYQVNVSCPYISDEQESEV
jgi:hypothetical protein